MPPGQGGFACIPGSHKANFSCPGDYATFAGNPGCVVEVPQRAGDVIIFTEALTPGAFPWTAAHQRRSVLFKYSPGHLAWADWSEPPAGLLDLLTPRSGACSDPLRDQRAGDDAHPLPRPVRELLRRRSLRKR
jgi:ectoine hydroxylase-related dioxygenase (phytanoyl-CoA dioxygenase family)